MSRKRANSKATTKNNKRARTNNARPNTAPAGVLSFDEDDINTLKLKQPYVNQAILLKIYFDKGSNAATGKTIQLDVTLYCDNGNEKVPTKHYTVDGAEISTDGAAPLQVTINTLSKQYAGHQFSLVVQPKDDNIHMEKLTTQPFSVISQRLRFVNEAPNLWYKDEGGRDKSMEFHIELCNTLGKYKTRDVPLLVTLHYDTEGYPQALTHTKASASGEFAPV